MSYTETASLKGSPLLTASTAFAAIRSRIPADQQADVEAWIEQIYYAAPLTSLNPDLILGQAILETDWFSSSWWRDRHNSGGIGITGDESQNDASQTWPSSTLSAIAHLAHLVAYVYGAQWPVIWPFPAPPISYDQRFNAPIAEGYHADTLDDLNGTWAIDRQNNYHGKIANRINQVLALAGHPPAQGEDPMSDSITFGRVPLPPLVSRLIPDSQNMAWNNLGQRVIRGVVWHTAYGTLLGTDGYFRGFANARSTRIGALTDLMVGVAGPDPASLDGVIYLWNNPSGRAAPGVSPNRAPWANGNVENPTGDGLLFWQIHGTNAINRDLVSIERSGNGTTPLTPKARASIVALTAYYADQYKVPWTDFPFVVNERRRSFVIHHGEIYGGKRTTCPGSVVSGLTNAMILDVKELLRQYQTGVVTSPEDPKPDPPVLVEIVPGIDVDLAARLFGIATGEDGRRYPFDINGPISNLWLERAKKEKAWPPLEDVWVYDDGRRYFRFENGWMVLVPPDEGPRWI